MRVSCSRRPFRRRQRVPATTLQRLRSTSIPFRESAGCFTSSSRIGRCSPHPISRPQRMVIEGFCYFRPSHLVGDVLAALQYRHFVIACHLLDTIRPNSFRSNHLRLILGRCSILRRPSTRATRTSTNQNVLVPGTASLPSAPREGIPFAIRNPTGTGRR
jgi:hypothetical protein